MCLSWWNKRRKVWQNWFAKMQENYKAWSFNLLPSQGNHSVWPNWRVRKKQGRQARHTSRARQCQLVKQRLWSPQCPIAGQWPCPGRVYDFKDQIAMLKSWLSLWLFCIMNRDNRQLWHLEPFSCLTSTLSGGAAHIACRGEIKISIYES